MPDEQNDNYSLIAHSSEARVLLLCKESGWTLPQHTATKPDEINAAMKAQLGLTTTVLSCVYDRYKDEEREEQKSPWESLGWFATVTTWKHEQLAGLGYTPSAPFEQVRTNFWSTAFRVLTTTSTLYFKASASIYA